MRFGILGPLEIVAANGHPLRIPESKVRALLADLVVHDGAPVSVDRLVHDLWGDQQPGNPTAALQRKVWQLRRTLEEAEPGSKELVVFQPSGYAFRVDDAVVDSVRFSALSDQAGTVHDLHRQAELLSEALTLWRGPALADFRDEEFAVVAINRLEEHRLAAWEKYAEVRLELGEYDQLVGELAELVAQHPLREKMRASYMRALYQAGRPSDALASYQDLREQLAQELGLDPSLELAGLHQAMLQQDSTLIGSPAPRSRHKSHAVQTNLSTPLTPLIGRREAVPEVHRRLSARRLVTLTGSGGVGKTRLAIGASRRLIEGFADGVWMVELAGLGRGSSSSPVDALAAVLGVRDDIGIGALPHATPMPLIDRLIDAVQGKKLLVVLDNCEQVIDQAAELVERLLMAAPDLRVLATSREPLGLAGEALFEVPPLETPTDFRAETSEDLAILQQFSAVQLFLARAADASGDFVLTQENAVAVATLCRRLDGIPLALELAATRVRALGVDGLVARLDDRFRLLATGHRGSPPRQQTLRAMIDWSWDLLTTQERIVLRRLAVHADGCTLDAAEAVCSDAEIPAVDVLDVLTRLVSRSLVVAVDGSRFRLLESVSSYCLQRLHESGEYEVVRRRHLSYYVELAERADSELRGSDQQAWLQRLDGEAANLRAALNNATDLHDPDTALRLVTALGWYWILRGRLQEGLRFTSTALSVDGGDPSIRAVAAIWQFGMKALLGGGSEPLSPALDLLADIDDEGVRARSAWFIGFALLGGGDVGVSENAVDLAMRGFDAVGDRWGLAAALSTRADLAVARGDLDSLARDGKRSLALFRELGDRWGQLQATEVLSSLAEITGDYVATAELRREGLGIAEELGLWSDVSHELSGLGRLALLRGDFAEAEELHQRARTLAIEQSTKAAQHFAELGLGLGARRQGHFDEAEQYLAAWLDWCEQVGWLPGKALILAELGFIAEQRGEADTALNLQVEGLAVADATGDARAVALALEGIAGAKALGGSYTHAARLLGVATAARERVGAPLPQAERHDVERIAAVLRTALGDTTFAVETEHGRQWDFRDCVQTQLAQLM